ncbi:chemotaxis protein CheB [Actimicrobium sp. CCI2.3]|uniref:chemotaxis protein CheB n=1 Tax=Actimicrobium sp. CCI2.3 TaxID=3048616 RepID=UPI002AB3A004|nr:chemotaxis protein CheB [Actimicrobium sp. CCI2.3]MDY7574638.1 chemotaxis protein CheB [Actimicrobium sp. CCI2.3]MEB0023990.1 chemotaxis protein CheB [Actimicrobium sp. CCI2.3]
MDEATEIASLPVPACRYAIGIGSSAGGLEALREFVACLSPGLNCIYVIAQHISPNYRSMMADILGRDTVLPVREAVDAELPAMDVVYIIPPGYNMVFRDERFHLSIASPEISPKPSVNLLFQSLAETFDERAIGVILSGTGSDGTRGLRAIKAAGGMTYVQTPESAKFKGMPSSAIDDCVADRILTPGAIAHEVERLVRFPDSVPENEGLEQRPAEMTELFERVRERTKIDFSSYKLSTVQRRLQRRMIVTEATTLSAYLDYVSRHEDELDALARETLISVTEFFRDKAAFDILAGHVAQLLSRKKSGDEVRIWVVGCATGEEAYSLAMLFSSLIDESGRPLHLHIFASDIDNNALMFARRGVYNQNAVAELPTDYLKRYFQVIGNGYEVTKVLRDCVTFARQDIVIDPPFLRLDLITCRNVLIYFNTDLQAKVMAVLRYALRDDGLLFLGRSETVNQQEDLFGAVDRKAHLYRPLGQGRPVLLGHGRPAPRANKPATRQSTSRAETSHARQFLTTAAESIGPAMLIDGGFRILHSQGDVDRFISFPSGAPEMNLAQLIVPELVNELLTTVRRAARHHARLCSRKRAASLHWVVRSGDWWCIRYCRPMVARPLFW